MFWGSKFSFQYFLGFSVKMTIFGSGDFCGYFGGSLLILTIVCYFVYQLRLFVV